MLFTSIVPVSGITLSEQTSQSLMTGNILYVGGLGPNNYTKIQDAVDNASDGDTVFVYDDSSPYYENVVVDKSIALIGEDKQTTVISGVVHHNASVLLRADGVTVQGFTIGNCYDGIRIESNNTIIEDNIITTNTEGIYLFKANNNKIDGNTISYNSWGIYSDDTAGDVISGNTITLNSVDGIMLGSSKSVVTLNNISGNGQNGLSVPGDNNTILQNNIVDNRWFGVDISNSKKNSILQNNIYDNQRGNARVDVDMWIVLLRRPFDHTWDGNYWGRPHQFPKIILGVKYLLLPTIFLQWFLYVLLQKQPIDSVHVTVYIPVIKFDWHPAQEPYDIPGMK
jgi:parallel beta-helix repeat protein